MDLKMLTFSPNYLTSPRIWKHKTCTKLLANQNQGCSHFPHSFQSSYEHLIHYHSEDSRACWLIVQVLSNVLIIKLKMVIIFWTHNPISFWTLLFLVSILGDTPNHIPLKYFGVQLRKRNRYSRIIYLNGCWVCFGWGWF